MEREKIINIFKVTYTLSYCNNIDGTGIISQYVDVIFIVPNI